MGTIYVDRLSEALEARVFSRVKFRERRLPHYLYHYTNKDGLEGIISQNRLWATSAAESPKNDQEEIHYGCDLFKQLIDDQLTTKRVSEFTAGILDDVKSLIVERIQNIFLTSFCTLDDDERMYKTFGGYCLRFPVDNRKDLRVVAPRGLAARQGFLTELVPAIYDRREQKAALLSLLNPLLQTLEDRSLIVDIDYGGWAPAMARFVAFTVSDLALTSLTRMKGPGYRRESEWRLVVRPCRLRFSSDPTEADRNCECFIKQGPPKRHVELAPREPQPTLTAGAVFGLPHSEPALPVETVRVSSCQHDEEAASVRQLLSKHDLHTVAVLKSRVHTPITHWLHRLLRIALELTTFAR
jgi:hypothetical protein